MAVVFYCVIIMNRALHIVAVRRVNVTWKNVICSFRSFLDDVIDRWKYRCKHKYTYIYIVLYSFFFLQKDFTYFSNVNVRFTKRARLRALAPLLPMEFSAKLRGEKGKDHHHHHIRSLVIPNHYMSSM